MSRGHGPQPSQDRSLQSRGLSSTPLGLVAYLYMSALREPQPHILITAFGFSFDRPVPRQKKQSRQHTRSWWLNRTESHRDQTCLTRGVGHASRSLLLKTDWDNRDYLCPAPDWGLRADADAKPRCGIGNESCSIAERVIGPDCVLPEQRGM